MEDVSLRFWRKVIKIEHCWEWAAYKNKKGYGQIKIQGKVLGAHRVSWLLAVGEIEAGLCVLHTCDNPKCVRPDHLFLGTNADNVDDKYKKGRAFCVTKFNTACKNGHLYTPENTLKKAFTTRSGRRMGRGCRACARENDKKYYRNKKSIIA
jgi:hypothetical protein